MRFSNVTDAVSRGLVTVHASVWNGRCCYGIDHQSDSLCYVLRIQRLVRRGSWCTTACLGRTVGCSTVRQACHHPWERTRDVDLERLGCVCNRRILGYRTARKPGHNFGEHEPLRIAYVGAGLRFSSFRTISGRVDAAEWVVSNIRVRIDRLAVRRVGDDRVDAEEPPQLVVVHPAVHVDEVGLVEVLVAGEAVLSGDVVVAGVEPV